MSVAIENIPVNWITPEEQRDRLDVEKGVQQQLDQFAAISKLGSDIIDESLMSLDYPKFTNWYTALERLHLLPDLVPALPENILDVFYSNCPIVEGKKVFETHSLYLIPPNSLNDLEARVSAYGRDALGAQNDDQNPLRFRGAYKDEIFQEHGNIPSDHWEWILISNDVLEESRNKIFADQVKTVENLSQRAMADYEIANLKQVASFLFLHKVATGESLLKVGNAQNGWSPPTYARVPQKIDGWLLIIGGSAPSGIGVSGDFDNFGWINDNVGIAALRKFSRALALGSGT